MVAVFFIPFLLIAPVMLPCSPVVIWASCVQWQWYHLRTALTIPPVMEPDWGNVPIKNVDCHYIPPPISTTEINNMDFLMLKVLVRAALDKEGSKLLPTRLTTRLGNKEWIHRQHLLCWDWIGLGCEGGNWWWYGGSFSRDYLRGLSVS